jgi:hypothetical protein
LLDEQDDKILNVKIDHIFELMNTKAWLSEIDWLSLATKTIYEVMI